MNPNWKLNKGCAVLCWNHTLRIYTLLLEHKPQLKQLNVVQTLKRSVPAPNGARNKHELYGMSLFNVLERYGEGDETYQNRVTVQDSQNNRGVKDIILCWGTAEGGGLCVSLEQWWLIQSHPQSDQTPQTNIFVQTAHAPYLCLVVWRGGEFRSTVLTTHTTVTSASDIEYNHSFSLWQLTHLAKLSVGLYLFIEIPVFVSHSSCCRDSLETTPPGL